MKKIILLLVLLGMLFSCKSKKNATENSTSQDSIAVALQKTKEEEERKNIADRLKFYEKIYIHPRTDFIKINAKISADNLRVSPLDATIYIETDKKIWANISFIFYNAARALITPNGIKAIDKYNKNYIDSDFGYFNQLLKLNIIDYKTLEKILTGKTFIKLSDRKTQLTENKEGFAVETFFSQKMPEDSIAINYKTNMQFSKEYDLTMVYIEEPKKKETIRIEYSNWEEFENKIRLPKNVKIIIKADKTNEILIENTKFGFTKMETPYSVPASYKKIDIK